MSKQKRSDPTLTVYKLNASEIADPSIVITEFFDTARLPQAREILWNWLKATVTGSYTKELSTRERTEIIVLYEKVEKLIEASHLLHERKRRSKQ